MIHHVKPFSITEMARLYYNLVSDVNLAMERRDAKETNKIISLNSFKDGTHIDNMVPVPKAAYSTEDVEEAQKIIAASIKVNMIVQNIYTKVSLLTDCDPIEPYRGNKTKLLEIAHDIFDSAYNAVIEYMDEWSHGSIDEINPLYAFYLIESIGVCHVIITYMNYLPEDFRIEYWRKGVADFWMNSKE